MNPSCKPLQETLNRLALRLQDRFHHPLPALVVHTATVLDSCTSNPTYFSSFIGRSSFVVWFSANSKLLQGGASFHIAFGQLGLFIDPGPRGTDCHRSCDRAANSQRPKHQFHDIL